MPKSASGALAFHGACDGGLTGATRRTPAGSIGRARPGHLRSTPSTTWLLHVAQLSLEVSAAIFAGVNGGQDNSSLIDRARITLRRGADGRQRLVRRKLIPRAQ